MRGEVGGRRTEVRVWWTLITVCAACKQVGGGGLYFSFFFSFFFTCNVG